MPLSFKRNLIFFLFLSGIIFPSTGVFASTACVCTTSDKDCREVTLSSAELLKLGCTINCKKNLCETACKKELGTKYGSFDFGQDIEGDMKRDACKKTNQTFLATAAAASTTKPATEAVVPKGTITPTLNIDIPGLSFTSAVSGACKNSDGGTCIRSNFLADYLTGIYQFLIAASISIAIIMVMIGGLQYTLGAGSPGMVSKGKTRIHNAVIGLVLLLGVYLILYTANPQLTILKTVELQNVEEEIFDFTSDTSTEAEDESFKKEDYKFKYFKSGCPITLTNPAIIKDEAKNLAGDIRQNVPRRLEFHQKIKSLLSGNIQQRVIMAVEAASKCKIHYENCGVVTTNMYALAAPSGSYANACLANEKGKSACNILGYSKDTIKKSMVLNMTGVKTNILSATGTNLTVARMLRGFYCPSVAKCGTKIYWPEPCIANKAQAAQRLASILKATGQWSLSDVDKLQPGDYYMIVNWNSSCQSTHSAMFLGWQDKANRIAWVEKGDAFKFVRTGSIKFGASDLVIQISRPSGP